MDSKGSPECAHLARKIMIDTHLVNKGEVQLKYTLLIATDGECNNLGGVSGHVLWMTLR